MGYLAELLRCDGTDFVRWRVLTPQMRKTLFDCEIAAPQRIILRIRDDRGVFRIVAVVVLGNLGSNAAKLLSGIRLAQLFYGNICHI